MAAVVTGPQVAMLGRRLHLQHGPIDLMIEAWGDEAEVRAAYGQARDGFAGVLDTLVSELPVLRGPAKAAQVTGQIARRMVAATKSHDGFITPMAAVAGAVADHVLAAMRRGRHLRKVVVNNGGDIALWLAPQETATLGVGDLQVEGVTLHPVTVTAADGIGGIATSGWRGRSHSLGIVDFVTVFACDAAMADAAATVIANAVDLPGSTKITRERADVLSPDSDLGHRRVTTGVAALTDAEARAALASGRALADTMVARGLIVSAMLGLQGQRAIAGTGATEPHRLGEDA